MKKLILILSSVLIFTLAGGLILDATQGTYNRERQFWFYEREYIGFMRHLETMTRYQAEQYIKKLRHFIKSKPQDALSLRAQLLLANTYMLQKSYDAGRKELVVIRKLTKDKNLIASAWLSIGKSYEMEGNWDKALEYYQALIKDYPFTSPGFSMPIRIAKSYLARQDKARGEEAYQQAISFYQDIIKKYPTKVIAFHARRMIILCYLDQKKWDKSLNSLDAMMFYYPNHRRLKDVIEAINQISLLKVKDYQRPIDIFTRFISRYPKHPFVPSLQKMIKSYRVLIKEKTNVTIQSP